MPPNTPRRDCFPETIRRVGETRNRIGESAMTSPAVARSPPAVRICFLSANAVDHQTINHARKNNRMANVALAHSRSYVGFTSVGGMFDMYATPRILRAPRLCGEYLPRRA